MKHLRPWDRNLGGVVARQGAARLSGADVASLMAGASSAGGGGMFSAPASGLPAARNPTFSNVYLLLHMNGTNGGTTFTDSSSYARTVGVGGNAQTSTAVSKFNGSSGLFDGTGDFLGVADTDFGFLTAMDTDFTVEAWVYPTNVADFRCIFQMGAAISQSFTLNLDSTTRKPYYALRSQSAGTETPSNLAVDLNAWSHVAATFKASTGAMACWVNGLLSGVNTKPSGTPGFPVGLDLAIGGYTDGLSYQWVGNLAELRVTRGDVLYTEPFQVPSSAFPNS